MNGQVEGELTRHVNTHAQLSDFGTERARLSAEADKWKISSEDSARQLLSLQDALEKAERARDRERKGREAAELSWKEDVREINAKLGRAVADRDGEIRLLKEEIQRLLEENERLRANQKEEAPRGSKVR